MLSTFTSPKGIIPNFCFNFCLSVNVLLHLFVFTWVTYSKKHMLSKHGVPYNSVEKITKSYQQACPQITSIVISSSAGILKPKS